MAIAKYKPHEFAKLWNEAESVQEIMDKTGFTYTSIRSMASRLRSYGVDLKDFRKVKK